jgi:hypothetical protein
MFLGYGNAGFPRRNPEWQGSMRVGQATRSVRTTHAQGIGESLSSYPVDDLSWLYRMYVYGCL